MSEINEMAVTEWYAAFTRVCALVEQAGATPGGPMDRPVPATPDWTARELLSHMVGLGHDVLAGDEPDDHNEAWTQAQVDQRADRTPTDLLAEWRDDADAMLSYLRESDVRPLNDLLIHEQDLRGALGPPGGRDTVGLHHVRDTMAARLAGRVGRLAPVRLEADDWSWQSHPGEPGVVLAASSYDLTRALTTRRTAGQLRSWVDSGDVEPFLEAFALLGPLPDAPLPE